MSCPPHALFMTWDKRTPPRNWYVMRAWLVDRADADYPMFADVSANFPAHVQGAQGVYVSPLTQGAVFRCDGETRDPCIYAAVAVVSGEGRARRERERSVICFSIALQSRRSCRLPSR